MGDMLKVKVRWAGFTGSPGWSNFYFKTEAEGFYTNDDADAIADRVDTFLVGIKGLFPPALNFTVQSDVEEIESTTGALDRVFSAGPRASIAGSAAANAYSAATGAVITWRTSGVRNGRRVRGRTFLVPTANVAFDIDGSLQNSTLTTLNTFATALITNPAVQKLSVWGRPTAPGATDGVVFPVNTASIPDMAAVLRSRRD